MSRQKIIFGVQADQAAVAEEEEDLELIEEREKHRKRAERFGTEVVEPVRAGQRKDFRQEFQAKQKRAQGFNTGFDLFSKEEVERRQERRERFQIEDEALKYVPAAPPEDEERRKERAARFGTTYEALDQSGQKDADLLEERKDPEAAVPRRPEAIHLYGVDVMSTAECLAYFGDYGPTHVEWIDDSSCNVVFADEYSAKRAIVATGNPLPPGDAPDQQGLDPRDVSSIPFLWHKGHDFQKGKQAVPLVFRMATVADVKGASARQRSRYLWKQPLGQNRQRQQQARPTNGKRARTVPMNGDVQMHNPPGSKRERKRKRQRGLGEVEMGDAEAWSGDEEGKGVMEIEGEEPADEPVSKRLPRDRFAASGMFSAARAGLIPAFLLDQLGSEDAADENREAVRDVPQDEYGDAILVGAAGIEQT